MIKLTCKKPSDNGEAEATLNFTFPVSVKGLLDAVKFAQSIKEPSIRCGAKLMLFNESVLLIDVVPDKSSVLEVLPVDPREPAPMCMAERAAMFLRLAEMGELKNFFRKEYAFKREQATAKWSLYNQGFMGDQMVVPTGFQGDAQFWYDTGRKAQADVNAELLSLKAA